MTRLLNYTTSVSAARTIAEVQKLLVGAGARTVMVTYDEDQRPAGLSFAVPSAFGMRTYALPVEASKVHAVLQRQRLERRYTTPEHAEKVAWRIIKDWLEAQLAITATEMVAFEQIMLPYMHTDSGRTVYEQLRADAQRALGEGV